MREMSVTLSPGVKRLLQEANFATIATLMPDGSPQVTVVWVDLDGDRILVNSAEGRVKVRNVRRDPRVGIDVFSLQNPYDSASIRGRVAELRHDGADEHIDKLARKYLDVETYPNRRPGEQRVILVIQPERVAGMGRG
jgi:PPOX class probable F420-dependent enzyme